MKRINYLLLLLLGLPITVLAQGNTIDRLRTVGRNAYGTETPLSPTLVASNIVSVALGFVGIIFLLLIVYAGFQWMTSGGSAEKIDKAKKMIVNSVIGLVVVIVAYAIATSVTIWIGDAVSDSAATPEVIP